MNRTNFDARCVRALVLHVPVLLAALAWSLPARAETVRLGGTGSALGTMSLLAKAYQRVDPSFQLELVPNLGSNGGVKALMAGSVQLAATSRELKPEEAAKGLVAKAYGRTAFVLATTKAGIDNLSLSQIAALYSGQQRQWGDGQNVRLVLRPASDGDTKLLADFSPEVKAGLDHALARQGMVTAMTDQDSVDAIERLPGGLGTATQALLLSEQRRARALSINGVAPTSEHVSSGRYPYAKTMYLIHTPGTSAAADGFIDFMLSSAGRKVLAGIGHVPAVAPKP
jgi:phosphate transport system substrate-binding protein